MAFAGHHNDHAFGASEDSDDDKIVTEQISHLSVSNFAVPVRTREAPPLVKNLSPEERHRLERALVRRIDRRLLPMVVLMYILNYLDRNNIAAARLAGLQKELRLTSIQYEVSQITLEPPSQPAKELLQTCISILFVGYVLMQGRCV